MTSADSIRGRIKIIKMNSKCKNCKHHDSQTWVCVNPDSSYVADFTDDEDWCSKFEPEEEDE